MSYVRGKDHPQYKHGMKKTPEWRAWIDIRRRCRKPEYQSYKNYGGRGIKVCERWNVFQNFIDDMGRKPAANLSIERIDNHGDYTPDNCRWATAREQSNNTRLNRIVVYHGKAISLADAIRIAKSGVTRNIAKQRLAKGWSMDRALDTPRERKLSPRWENTVSP